MIKEGEERLPLEFRLIIIDKVVAVVCKWIGGQETRARGGIRGKPRSAWIPLFLPSFNLLGLKQTRHLMNDVEYRLFQ